MSNSDKPLAGTICIKVEASLTWLLNYLTCMIFGHWWYIKETRYDKPVDGILTGMVDHLCCHRCKREEWRNGNDKSRRLS